MESRTRSKASSAQLMHLAEYMRTNNLSFNNSKSLEDRVNFEKKWVQLKDQLNSLAGPKKSLAKWKQTWRDLRNNNVKKRKASRCQGMLREDEDSSSVMNGAAQLGHIDPQDEELVDLHDIKTDPTFIYDDSNISRIDLPAAAPTASSMIQSDILKLEMERFEFQKKQLALEERRLDIEEAKVRAFNRIADALEKMNNNENRFK